MTLSARLEAAKPDEQRELLEETWHELMRRRHGECAAAVWGTKQSLKFEAMLDANAFESAAISLVPEGWFWSYNSRWGTAIVWTSEDPGSDLHGEHHTESALAIAAAIAIAKAKAKAKAKWL